jgi:hypothetical protein
VFCPYLTDRFVTWVSARSGRALDPKEPEMPTYMYLYRGPKASTSTATQEESDARMAAFAAWMDRTGPALVDVGSPFGASVAVSDDGTPATAGDLVGYSLVEADDLAHAQALTDGLPFLAQRDGTCTVEIFELANL